MAQPLLKLYILLFLWFDTENVFSKNSNCLKEKREENSKNVQLAQVKLCRLMVFPVKYLCLGVVPNRSSFPTTGTLLMSQRDHPWVWVQPILQRWMPLDKREEGVFSWEFSLWVCIQTAIRYLDAILPQPLLSWGGSAFARTVLTCGVSCRVSTRVKSWRLWAVMGWVPAAHLHTARLGDIFFSWADTVARCSSTWRKYRLVSFQSISSFGWREDAILLGFYVDISPS